MHNWKLPFIKNRFWRDFEKFNNCKYPTIIKDILAFCAIEQVTFSDINDDIIKEIEAFVNQNKSVLQKSLEKSSYANVFDDDQEFKFLFGHRLLLLKLPIKYQLFCDKKMKRKK